jgi:rare lipoprotein A (peptidoglycan hydrolase)
VTALNRDATFLREHYRGAAAANASLNKSGHPDAMKSQSGSNASLRKSIIALALTALALAACAAPSPEESAPPVASPSTPVERQGLPRFAQTGLASWYERTKKMVRTANGEKLGADKMTAAHRTLPMDTIVRVTNLNNGRSVQVRINDRGPFIASRIIDLTHDAALQLGMKDDGVAPVRIEVYDQDQVAKDDARRTAAK